jgi:fimbrial isopeptide formation D2 family protein/LPXTG-motif cell wall-anchored protein
MKRIKTIAVLTLALMILLTAAVPVFAEGNADAVVKSHSFNAYQILSAKSAGDHLTALRWGSAFADAAAQSAFLGALKADERFVKGEENIFASCTDPESLARVLERCENDSEVIKNFAALALARIKSSGGSSCGVYKDGDTLAQAGYYLFEDASGADAIVVNPTILRMTADSKVNIKVKTSIPYVEKKVYEKAYQVDYASRTITAQDGSACAALHYGAGYSDTADYSAGSMIPFELIGTLPSNITDYSAYYYAFKDKMSGGLTFDLSKAGVSVGLYDVSGGSYALVSDVTNLFTVSVVTADGGTEVTFACEDLLDESFPAVTANSVIIVRYSVELNANASSGAAGNTNSVTLIYSNRIDEPESTGESESDETVVFTYSVRFLKTDSYDGSGLKDAGFVLQNSEGKYYSVSGDSVVWTTDRAYATVLYSGSSGVIEVSGLDKGQYTVTEVIAPKDHKLLSSPITFTIQAKILCDSDDPDYAQQYMSTADLDAASKAFSAEDFCTVININTENAATAQSLSPDDLSAATAVIGITNDRIFDLPGTGGSGTVFFYIGGGLLIAGAIVLLIIKVRAK